MDTHTIRKISALGTSLLKNPSFLGSYLKYLPAWSGTPIENGLPWISFGALRFLRQRLEPSYDVFEYGGGGSTVYFALRTRSVTTMESHPEWHRKLTAEIQTRGITNATCEYHPISGDRLEAFQHDAYFHRVSARTWDVIMIDCYCGYSETRYGQTRAFAFELALPQIKPGGFLILDDSWMFPELLQPRKGWRITDHVGPGPCRYGVTSTAIFEKL